MATQSLTLKCTESSTHPYRKQHTQPHFPPLRTAQQMADPPSSNGTLADGLVAPRSPEPGDVCVAKRDVGGMLNLSRNMWRSTWGAPSVVLFDQSHRCSVQAELMASRAWLNVVHTSDMWAKRQRGVWMYYARGCSRLQWYSGNSFVASNRLDAAVRLSLNGTCDLTCAARSVAAEVNASASTIEALLAPGTQPCRPGMSAADRELVRLAVGSHPLDMYMLPLLIRGGFDSLRLLFQPGGKSWIGHHVQTELWDVRDGVERSMFSLERDATSHWARYLRCDGRPCAPRYIGTCLVCGECSEQCVSMQPRQPSPPPNSSALRRCSTAACAHPTTGVAFV